MVVHYWSNDRNGGPPNDGIPPGWSGPVDDGPPSPPSSQDPPPAASNPTPVFIPYPVATQPSFTAPPPAYYLFPASLGAPPTPPHSAPAPTPAPPYVPPPPSPPPPPYRTAPPSPPSPLRQPAPPSGLPELLSHPLTTIHLVAPGTRPLPYSGAWDPHRSFPFTKHTASPDMPVWKLIKVVRSRDDPEREMGLVEIYEMGNGRWAKGSRIGLSDERALLSLEAVGWGGMRGHERKPVWLCLARSGE
ncbi:hedgehog receptor activity [Thelotrema lepadinum]|nr:hedgehog receptor activity [Thelotrema lepadinum]